MFKKVKTYTLNRVRDQVTFREGNEEITLHVDADANAIVRRIQQAQEKLQAIKADSTREDRRDAAIALSQAMFGDDQTDRLFEFYHDDENSVVTICGMYFADPKNGLGKKITATQKKRR